MSTQVFQDARDSGRGEESLLPRYWSSDVSTRYNATLRLMATNPGMGSAYHFIVPVVTSISANLCSWVCCTQRVRRAELNETLPHVNMDMLAIP